MIDNRTQVFDVAMKNARTIQACLDRLAMMGADHQLKLIAGRLSRLTQCAERRSRHDQLTNAALSRAAGPGFFSDAAGAALASPARLTRDAKESPGAAPGA